MYDPGGCGRHLFSARPHRGGGLVDCSVMQIADWSTTVATGSNGQRGTACCVTRGCPGWVPGSRLEAVLIAPFLIAACARFYWARGVFGIKDGLVALCGGRWLASEGWYMRLRVCFRPVRRRSTFGNACSKPDIGVNRFTSAMWRQFRQRGHQHSNKNGHSPKRLR